MKLRAISVFMAVAVIIPTSISAQDLAIQSLKDLFDVTKRNVIATAEMLDTNMYQFRPTDQVRSTGEILAHIADWQYVFCSAAAGEENPRPEDFEETRTTKARIIDALEMGFAYCESVYERATDVGAPRTLFGRPNCAPVLDVTLRRVPSLTTKNSSSGEIVQITRALVV